MDAGDWLDFLKIFVFLCFFSFLEGFCWFFKGSFGFLGFFGFLEGFVGLRLAKPGGMLGDWGPGVGAGSGATGWVWRGG